MKDEGIYAFLGKNLYKLNSSPTEVSSVVNPSNLDSGTSTGFTELGYGGIKQGKTAFDNTETGFILGIDDNLSKFYIGNTTNYLNWTGTALVIAGSITATTGSIGGFDIGSDYIRDTANSMGLASTVTGGNDVRFWANSTYANRAAADFRVHENGLVSITSLTTNAGTLTITDLSSNELLILQRAGVSAVNYIQIQNSETTLAPDISVQGDDTNIGLGFTAKGTGVYGFNASATLPTTIRLLEQTTNGTNYIDLTVAASITSNFTLTLPSATDTLVGKATTDTLTNKTFTAPRFADLGFIADSSGNEMLVFDESGSAVNHIGLLNVATGSSPRIGVLGDDININFLFQAKGTGSYIFQATQDQQTIIVLREDVDNGFNQVNLTVAASLAADYTVTLPSATDTLVGKATTDTLTNKTISTGSSMAESLLTFTDITTNNASTSVHGFLKKLSNVSTEFMNGVGNWATPASGVTDKTGTTTRDLSTASGDQTIAHGLGATPTKVRITVIQASTSGATDNYSFGAYDGTNSACVYRGQNSNSQFFVGNDASNIISIFTAATADTSPSTATVTVDGTNITLAWTKAAGASGTAYILWEVYT